MVDVIRNNVTMGVEDAYEIKLENSVPNLNWYLFAKREWMGNNY